MRACRTGRYILLPREEVISNSYAALTLMVAQVQSHIAGRPIPAGGEMKAGVKKRRGESICFGERFRARAHQLSPRLREVANYINDNREVVLERTAMEIATATHTSDATVVRGNSGIGFCRATRIKKRPWRAGSGRQRPRRKKMRSTVGGTLL